MCLDTDVLFRQDGMYMVLPIEVQCTLTERAFQRVSSKVDIAYCKALEPPIPMLVPDQSRHMARPGPGPVSCHHAEVQKDIDPIPDNTEMMPLPISGWVSALGTISKNILVAWMLTR